MHKTSAWPLSLIYAALVVFASLFPFTGWRAQGIDPWVFLTARIPPPYWTWFDINTNWIGYAPMGFFLALALVRTGRGRWAVPLAALACSLLSLGLEFLQIYLPQRVSSNLDWLLNSVGGLAGALIAALLERWGALARWSRFRAQWLVHDARGPLVLLALWPWALLFPVAEPFGLGQGLERLELALAELLEGTPFLAWLPVRTEPLDPLSPLAELLCVALGLWAPCLLVCHVTRPGLRRAALVGAGVGVGVAVTALSTALSFGPAHAWDWLSAPAQAGIGLGALLALAALPLPPRAAGLLLLVALPVQLSLLNNAPASAYFAETLQVWEQGRFIRFYGLGQWLGWLWPYATLAVVLLRAARMPRPS